TVYIDPVLNGMPDEDGCERRLYPIPFKPDTVRADYLICTHGHSDHLAMQTVTAAAAADPHLKLIVPRGCVPLLKDSRIAPERIIPADAGKMMELPGLTVRPVSAAHPVHQTDEAGADLALCYSLRMGQTELLHLGDTYLTGQLLHDLQALPAPHLFFPPINGSDYFRTARDCIGNLEPLEAARLAAMLHADLSIPTHFDLVQGNTMDPLRFAQALWQENPAAKWHIPALGERFLYRHA
ncbi:MAG: MBL fold metallo-hydrolase, partial [Butyricicoccaceae bacterium]